MTTPLRTLAKPKLEHLAQPHPPASITLPSLRAGGVCDVLATIFTEPDADGPFAYRADDPDDAHEAGLRQLRCYLNWVHDSGVRLTRFDDRNHSGRDVEAEPTAYASKTKTHTEQTIRMGVLVENADPIRTPDELPWWVERGVVAIGLTWASGSRYSGGNASGGGLTDLGRAMVDAMDAHRIVHDLSHLSQKATDEVLERARGPVIASHSNCRALLEPDNERHLTDDVIREIGERDGVIGLNLCAPFVRTGLKEGERPSVEEALRHVEHICDLVGHRRCVGLGSDMDGGFSADHLPAGIDAPKDLERLAEGLSSRAWSDDDINAFAYENWIRFFRRVGAQSPS